MYGPARSDLPAPRRHSRPHPGPSCQHRCVRDVGYRAAANDPRSGCGPNGIRQTERCSVTYSPSTRETHPEQLAAKIRIASDDTIRAWERGTQLPRPRHLLKVAAALDIDPAELLPRWSDTTLRSLRLARGLTLQQTADRMGFTLSTYHRLEHGLPVRQPDSNTITALARVLKARKATITTLVNPAGQAKPRG
jgi:transcriptional regulator with XRE-family HTH domain